MTVRCRDGEVPLPYADRFTVMLWAVCCLGGLELGVVHVLTVRWPLLQWSLIALGIYGLLWCAALTMAIMGDTNVELRFEPPVQLVRAQSVGSGD